MKGVLVMAKIEIYQLPMEKDMAFCNMERFKKAGFRPHESDYEKVYTFEEDMPEDMVEFLIEVYCRFNLNHPEDFRGHSLSVSDIISVDGVAYFCDSFGFEKIETFFVEAGRNTKPMKTLSDYTKGAEQE